MTQLPLARDVNHARFLVATASNSWETRLVEQGLFPAPFDLARFDSDINHAGFLVATASNSCESTRLVEQGLFPAPFELALFGNDINHA
jgi:hypothetical protein